MTEQTEQTAPAEQAQPQANAPEPATLVFRRKEFAAKPGSTVRAAIKHCGLNPETVLATCDGKLITDEVIIRPGDRIKLVATISGG